MKQILLVLNYAGDKPGPRLVAHRLEQAGGIGELPLVEVAGHAHFAGRGEPRRENLRRPERAWRRAERTWSWEGVWAIRSIAGCRLPPSARSF